MKDGNWIPLDKGLVYFLPRDRAYTILEAMYSYQVDLDNNDEKSEVAYSRIWSWSRSKVRRFVTDLKTGKRHSPDSRETGKRHEVFYKFKDLDVAKDKQKTGKRQAEDREKTVTKKTIKTLYKDKVLLYDEEYKKLVDQFGEKGTDMRITNLNLYLCSKGKKYASHYHTILAWERKNNPEPNLINPQCTTPVGY